MAEIKTGVFAKNVQKRINRAQEKVLQKLGKADETKDEEFDQCVQNFKRQESEGARLQREMKAYIAAVKGMQQASMSLTESLHEVYEPEWHGKDDVMSIGKNCDALWEDFHEKLVDSTILALDTYLAQFPDLKVRVAKRSRKLIDYDSARHHFETLQTTAVKNERKVTKAEEDLKKAQKVFDDLNVDLQDELPNLWDSRVGFYVNTFKSVSSLEAKFHREISIFCHKLYEVMNKLAEQHSDKMFTIQGAPSDSGPLRLARTPTPPEDESPEVSPATSPNHTLRPTSPGPPRPKSPSQLKMGPPKPPPPKVTPSKEIAQEQIINLFDGGFPEISVTSPQANEKTTESLLDLDFDPFKPDSNTSVGQAQPPASQALSWDLWTTNTDAQPASDAGFNANWTADFGSVSQDLGDIKPATDGQGWPPADGWSTEAVLQGEATAEVRSWDENYDQKPNPDCGTCTLRSDKIKPPFEQQPVQEGIEEGWASEQPDSDTHHFGWTGDEEGWTAEKKTTGLEESGAGKSMPGFIFTNEFGQEIAEVTEQSGQGSYPEEEGNISKWSLTCQGELDGSGSEYETAEEWGDVTGQNSGWISADDELEFAENEGPTSDQNATRRSLNQEDFVGHTHSSFPEQSTIAVASFIGHTFIDNGGQITKSINSDKETELGHHSSNNYVFSTEDPNQSKEQCDQFGSGPDPFAASEVDPFGTDSFSNSDKNLFASETNQDHICIETDQDTLAHKSVQDPFASETDWDPFANQNNQDPLTNENNWDHFANKITQDPFASETNQYPFAIETTQDPFERETNQDPFKGKTNQDHFANETNQDLFASEINQDPVGSEINQDPLAKGIHWDPRKDPLANKTNQDPLASETTQDPFERETNQDPFVCETNQDPFKGKTNQGHFANETNQDLFASEINQDPVGSETNQDPLAKGIHWDPRKDPLANKTNQDPLASEADQDPYASETNEDPFASKINEDPVASETNQDPFANETVQDLFTSDINKDPFASVNNQDSFASETVQDLFTSETNQDPSTNKINKDNFSSETNQNCFANETNHDPFVGETDQDPFANKTSWDPFATENTLDNFIIETKQDNFARETVQAPFTSKTKHDPFNSKINKDYFASDTYQYHSQTIQDPFANKTNWDSFSSGNNQDPFTNESNLNLFATETNQDPFDSESVQDPFTNRTIQDLFTNKVNWDSFAYENNQDLFTCKTKLEAFASGNHENDNPFASETNQNSFTSVNEHNAFVTETTQDYITSEINASETHQNLFASSTHQIHILGERDQDALATKSNQRWARDWESTTTVQASGEARESTRNRFAQWAVFPPPTDALEWSSKDSWQELDDRSGFFLSDGQGDISPSWSRDNCPVQDSFVPCHGQNNIPSPKTAVMEKTSIAKEPENSDLSEDEVANRRYGKLYQEIDAEKEEVSNRDINGLAQADASVATFVADFDKMSETPEGAETGTEAAPGEVGEGEGEVSPAQAPEVEGSVTTPSAETTTELAETTAASSPPAETASSIVESPEAAEAMAAEQPETTPADDTEKDQLGQEAPESAPVAESVEEPSSEALAPAEDKESPIEETPTVEGIPQDDTGTVETKPGDETGTLEVKPEEETGTLEVEPEGETGTLEVKPEEEPCTLEVEPEGETGTVQVKPGDEASKEGASKNFEEEDKMPIPSVVIEPASSNEGDDDRDGDILSPTASSGGGVTPDSQSGKDISSSGMPAGFLYKVETMHDFEAANTDELDLKKGDIVLVVPTELMEDQDAGWLTGIREIDWLHQGASARKGLFPENFIQRLG